MKPSHNCLFRHHGKAGQLDTLHPRKHVMELTPELTRELFIYGGFGLVALSSIILFWRAASVEGIGVAILAAIPVLNYSYIRENWPVAQYATYLMLAGLASLWQGYFNISTSPTMDGRWMGKQEAFAFVINTKEKTITSLVSDHEAQYKTMMENSFTLEGFPPYIGGNHDPATDTMVLHRKAPPGNLFGGPIETRYVRIEDETAFEAKRAQMVESHTLRVFELSNHALVKDTLADIDRAWVNMRTPAFLGLLSKTSHTRYGELATLTQNAPREILAELPAMDLAVILVARCQLPRRELANLKGKDLLRVVIESGIMPRGFFKTGRGIVWNFEPPSIAKVHTGRSAELKARNLRFVKEDNLWKFDLPTSADQWAEQMGGIAQYGDSPLRIAEFVAAQALGQPVPAEAWQAPFADDITAQDRQSRATLVTPIAPPTAKEVIEEKSIDLDALSQPGG